MTADRQAARWSWRDASVVIMAAEAIAVAIWLVPASIHIVRWPSSGPVRLALMAPTWQLAALCGGAFMLGAAMVVGAAKDGTAGTGRIGGTGRMGRTGMGGMGGMARTLGPFLLLWLWVVPYLPWLPDRLPLLLILAGPMRWAVAAAAVVSVLLRTTVLHNWLTVFQTVSRRTVFVASLVVYVALGVHSARTVALGGDEPHYLVITESLLKDGDLKIENNHQRGDYLSFYQGELRPDFLVRGKSGEIYSIHAPGLPALLLPAYAVGGRLGAVAFLALIAALTALAVFDLANALAGRPAAVVTWAATCLTVPFVPHAWLVFPEMPGALVVAWAALWVWETRERSEAVWVWRGLALATLPWLHTKFVVLLAFFAAALALRIWKRPRALVAFALPLVVSGALWLYSFYAIYGRFDPEAPYSDYTSTVVLTKNIPHGLLGILFDQKFGLLFYSPIYLAAIAGAWLILRRKDTRFLGITLLTVAGAFAGSSARLYMFWGGNSAPARFLVPILPCLAPLIALAVANAKSAMSRALTGLWLAISLAMALIGVARPDRFMLFSDPHGGGARILEAIQAGSPLSGVIPVFTNPDWASHLGQLGWWLSAAAVSLAAMALTSRFARNAGAWRLAGVACLTFLLAGAVAGSNPGAEVRSSTAVRGDLDVMWRFDGNRFRTLDYETLGRTTPERLRELTTIVVEPQPSQITRGGYTAGPMTLPPGAFETRVWFAGAAAREGEVIVSTPPQATFGRVAGPLPNPTTVPFDLPVSIGRLTVRVPDPRVAEAISHLDIAPVAVVPAGEREDIRVRAIESVPGLDAVYVIYTDEHAYPEGGVFWSRGTAQTSVWVVPAGRSTLTLTLSTGPMSGHVIVSVAGKTTTVAMAAGELKVVSFDVPPGRRLVPLTVQSDVMFRPAEVDKTSTDMRGLGCQVRIGLE